MCVVLQMRVSSLYFKIVLDDVKRQNRFLKMATIDPLNDADFEGYMIPSHALFLSMVLHYMQPWTEVLAVASRIVLYFVTPMAWVATQSKRPSAQLLYGALILPWLIKCTTEGVPSIDTYCSLSAILSILPAYIFVFQYLCHKNRFLTYREKIRSCLVVFGGILLAAIYTMEKRQVHAIQQSFPFVGVREAFGLSVAEKVLHDATYTYAQRAIYLFFGVIVFPLTNHLYMVLVILLIKMICTKKHPSNCRQVPAKDLSDVT